MAKLEVDRKNTAIMGVANLLTECRKIASRFSATGQIWFRGIQDITKHKLVPSIGRTYWFGGKCVTFDIEDEKRLLRRFRRLATQFEGRTLDEWEAMFLGRHHGLPVRLMDWTANPLVAFYMACEHEDEQRPADGCIWMLVPRHNHSGCLDILDSTGTSPFDVRGVKILDPMIVSPRISVQAGIFTLHEYPHKPLDELGNVELDEHLDVSRLVGYQILGTHKPMRLKELNDLGINRRTLFPDYDGLVRGVISEEVLATHSRELNRSLREKTPRERKKVRWPA